jgi:UDP-N-acetylmuramoylalanine--D-glutamate ligase
MLKLLPGKGRTAGVAGMGRSGAAAARLLAERGYRVRGFDVSPDASGVMHLESLVTGSPSAGDMKGLSFLVLSPGIPVSSSICTAAAMASVPVIGEIELAWAATDSTILAVTGSNGKTTTAEWLGHALKESGEFQDVVVAGNTGYAACDAITDHPNTGMLVLEVSSYQLETISHLRPLAGAFLNLTQDHLERHGSMENYGNAKARLFMNQTEDDFAVLNADDPMLQRFIPGIRAGKLFFSTREKVAAGAWLDHTGSIRFSLGKGEEELMKADELPIPGIHNVSNALAVICMAFAAGLSPSRAAASLSGFRGVPHRLEILEEKCGLRWVNDSKSTNADSLKVALLSFGERVTLLAGGLGKESDYGVLRSLLKERTSRIILFGKAAGALAEQWKGTSDITLVNDLEEAVEAARNTTEPGGTVLLSPGCASFDQYRDFEARGEHFRRIVGGLE